MPKYTGFTAETVESLLLDSGAFFTNFEVGTDTYETAVTAGKLIGATRGGGKFSAIAQIREMPVDGVPGAAKGMERIQRWDVNLIANVLELTKEAIKKSLVAVSEDTSDVDYDVITGKNDIELTDYIDNITWVGTLAGSEKPVIIQVLNAFNQDGLSLSMQENDEGVAALNFKGHYDASDLTAPPFKIYYPKPVA